MASNTNKMYPPIIAGTTPPFYLSETGTYICIVPFSLNQLITPLKVGGVKLRIRDADTDIELGRLNSISYELSSNYSYAQFDLTNLNGIVVGKYYKIQIAYINANNANDIGFYSTVSIIKCTAYPTVSIIELNSNNVNTNCTYYTGQYLNINDITEKCYQYKFTLYNESNTILTTTDWLLHNSNTDDESWSSLDTYILNYDCGDGDRYELQYSILTQNGLEVNSPRYVITGGYAIWPQLDADLIAKVNHEEGCIDLYLEPNTNNEDVSYAGMFVICRSSKAENYKTQIQIVTFNLTGTLPIEPIYRDFTVEQGQTYQYSLQQFNNHGIYSARIYAYEKDQNNEIIYNYDYELNRNVLNRYITAYFEDMFLYDGAKQLKIRFNPKVSSFKTILQESKKNTLGSKYPFFFKNGIIEYKEFQIAGLISYLMDNNEFFLSRKKDLQIDSQWTETTNIIDENIFYERQFKLAVLDWLNDGNVKLFRSPSEGNYLVRLTNVSLIPEDTLSRMIHNFSCTADEIDQHDPQTLSKYGFVTIDKTINNELRQGTIKFSDYIEDLIKQLSNGAANPSEEIIQEALELFTSTNLINGYNCQIIQFEDCLPKDTKFTIDNEHIIMIGATGNYEQHFATNEVINTLRITNAWRYMPGQVTFGIWTSDSAIFNDIIEVKQKDVIDFPEYLGTTNIRYNGKSYNVINNYFNDLNNIKEQVQDVMLLQFELNTVVYYINSLVQFAADNNFTYTERNLNTSTEALIEKVQLYNSQIAKVYKITFNNENLMNVSVDTIGTRDSTDLFVDGAIFFVRDEHDRYYTYNATTQSLIAIYYDDIYVPIINSYNEYTSLGPTQICIDDRIIDIAYTENIYTYPLGHNNDVPKYLAWGALVQPTILYQMLGVTYNIERTNQAFVIPNGYTKNLIQAKQEYLNIKKRYLSYILQLEEVSNSSILSQVKNVPNSDFEEQSFYIWNDDTSKFEHLLYTERLNFTGSSVWIPYSFTNSEEQTFVQSPVIKDNVRSAYNYYIDILTAILNLNNVKAVF